MASPITLSRLREIVHYDPHSGVFTWCVDRGGHVKAGKVAGSLSPTGYWVIRLDDRLYPAHRLAWLYMTGGWPPHDIDHENLERADNRFANLRSATRAQNRANTRVHKHNKCGFKGVSFRARGHRNPYEAKIRINKKLKHLGNFATAEEAHSAYAAAARQHYGEFARAD